MEKLKDVLIRYSIITGIPLKIENNKIDLNEFFNEVFQSGLISKGKLEEIYSIIH